MKTTHPESWSMPRAGAPFNARLEGDGERLVVLHHGFGTTQAAWVHQVQALKAAGYRTLVLDAAGATAETLPRYHPQRHHTLDGFAEDLLELLQALGIEQADFVGHSVGSMIGVLAGNAQPGLFRTMSLIGASACYINDPATGYVGGFSRAQIIDLIAAMRSDYATWANGFAAMVVANAERPLLASEFTRSLMLLRPDIASAVLETIFLSDCRADVVQVKVPTLMLQTARDPAVPLEAAQWLAHAVRAERLEVIDAEGHFPHIAAPDTVTRLLLEFLALHEAPRG